MNDLPVVIIGAGPIGLAAAAQVRARGLTPLVLESGGSAGSAVRSWSHVRMFSQWSELVDPLAAELLAPTGWRMPAPDAYPTGADWAERYLEPLARLLGKQVRYGARVTGVAKRARDLVVDAGRSAEPFTVHLTAAADAERIEARAVIDASGTWASPNPLGGDGLPALGEHLAAARMSYRVPDLWDEAARTRYAGRHVVVAGSGHSAMTALVSFAQLAEEFPETRITWLTRRQDTRNTFGGGDNDQLAARGALGQRAKAAVEARHIRTGPGFRTVSVAPQEDGRLEVESLDGRRVKAIDEMVVVTGFRPDLSMLSEIRLDLDDALQAPRTLAPLIDPNVHSCGTVYPHGAKELAQPEPGFYLAGMKSYGRAPSFLALTGFEQVRSVVAEIAGDHESAAQVELTLPETGVCGGTGLFDESPGEEVLGEAGSCCGAAAVLSA